MLPLIAAMAFAGSEGPSFHVLVFSKTAGFRHDSIETGQQALKEIAAQKGFEVETTEDPANFNADKLGKVQAVVFLNTTGDVLDGPQQTAMENFIRGGGGYVGIHSAADTEYDWPFYGELVGAWFLRHPSIQEAKVKNEGPDDATVAMWPAEFTRTDEWYDYRTNPRSKVKVLLSMVTDSYKDSAMPDDHPITWCHEMDKGRAWYTGFGHTKETYADPKFREMIYQALLWVTRNS